MKTIRPLSPHLSIYKPQLTSTLSIFHRMTGAGLSVFLFLSVLSYQFYLIFAPSCSLLRSFGDLINHSTNHWMFLSLAFLILFAFYYHVCNGIRHLFWDFGYGLDIKQLYTSGYAVLIVSFSLTVLTWILPGLLG
uniref:Succinate dehydrogenase subunit 3 n=1 Tax=Andalucia godoyi TaxID=505711 RepID=M4QCU6_ANDGO|nr:succinate dehydrogenase subunit 3 [Andalucia godoyi]AGH24020.1 succinate dehydrogenase subunit 3 [Andalucia godoyi]